MLILATFISCENHICCAGIGDLNNVDQRYSRYEYRVVTEEREVTDMVPVVEYVDVPRIEMVPRVITEEVEEVITVPVVREVPVTRMVEVPTGK